MAALRAQYEQLKRERWAGFSGYDAYLSRANNASFGVQAAYTQWAPAFEALFEREERDFKRFHAAVQRLAALPRDERIAALRALLP
jgi:predicted aminopeptidase